MHSKSEILSSLQEMIRYVEKTDRNYIDVDELPASQWPFLRYNGRVHARLDRIECEIKNLANQEPRSCYLNNAERGETMQFMANIGEDAKASATSHLKEILSGTTQLTICDPYFLTPFDKNKVDEYVNGIFDAIPPSVKRIKLYVMPRRRNASVGSLFSHQCKEKGIRIECYRTNELHDRVWISDSQKAFAVGASFNGLGNKCAFILKLPPNDTLQFLAHLDGIRDRSSRSNSA